MDVERPDHHCGDDLVSPGKHNTIPLFWCILQLLCAPHGKELAFSWRVKSSGNRKETHPWLPSIPSFVPRTTA